MWYYIYLLGGIDMINNGWIDANGNIISVKENINDSAFNYCEKYLPPHIKNILHLYIIKNTHTNNIIIDTEILIILDIFFILSLSLYFLDNSLINLISK